MTQPRYSYQQIDNYANYLITKLQQNNNSVTGWKINYLLYLAYVYYLINHNKSAKQIKNRMFNLRFEAKVNGPSIPHITKRFANRAGSFSDNIVESHKPYLSKISLDAKEALDYVIHDFGPIDQYSLESICHHKPWIIARKQCEPIIETHNVLSDYDIFEYYKN